MDTRGTWSKTPLTSGSLPPCVYLDDEPLRAASADTVAAALLAAGVAAFRSSPVSGESRAPYSMIGNCFDCLVEIDDWPDRQACPVSVAEGMRVRRQVQEKAR